jgi:hypothetical protein
LLIAWVATGLAACVEDHLHDKALTWVNRINTATDHAELDVLLPQVERWLSRSLFHVRAYVRADAQLGQWESFYDPRKLTPMTESEAREMEPVPPDCSHNVEARERIRELCATILARTADAG